jgi:HemY protein
MRLALLLGLLALAAGAAAGLFLHDEAGYVLVSVGPWILETSVLGFITSLIVAIFGLYWGARLIVAVLRLPVTVQAALAARRAQRAQDSFESGLQLLLEGQWSRAEVDLVRRAADHHNAGLNYLLAARAAQRAGAPERREHYLELAGRQGEAPAFASRLLRAELLLERGEPGAALPVLQAALQQQPRHPYVIELLAETYVRTQAWDALRQLLSGTEGPRALNPGRYRELLGRALHEELARAGAAARLEALKSMWDATHAPFRAMPALRLVYLRGLARFGADTEVAAQITRVIEQGYDGGLVDLYGELGGLDPVTQLATVEQWLNQHGEKIELLLAAGRVCTRNRLWGKARSYLDAALRLRPSPEIFLALAKLCEQAKQPEEASLFSRRGLEATAARDGAR